MVQHVYFHHSDAAWWSMASQLAAQDYLARLSGSTHAVFGHHLAPDPLLAAASLDYLAAQQAQQLGTGS